MGLEWGEIRLQTIDQYWEAAAPETGSPNPAPPNGWR
jgi:hypothetical protein